ncbi:hypothetical protein LZ30DRAFT_298834 [Colletotrichum cereale]|nr:hypothetical protein LZ30DRAFT_298834 [Colletotrichum cereale]
MEQKAGHQETDVPGFRVPSHERARNAGPPKRKDIPRPRAIPGSQAPAVPSQRMNQTAPVVSGGRQAAGPVASRAGRREERGMVLHAVGSPWRVPADKRGKKGWPGRGPRPRPGPLPPSAALCCIYVEYITRERASFDYGSVATSAENPQY